ncbi:hypothetical protein CFIO01_03887 [Colletotrichum fioriniae PJ7]|uniref:Uncharacterized protein n=1 Tax=Colletotrichum fioriniae PJ7 TaxID=1445577 RepID=A0A010RZZ4_9PEZI|nr:hypothetical protein CFIO01_03887 [Colletotrichum fioriniae PJ7]
MSDNRGASDFTGSSDPNKVPGPFDVETPRLSEEQRTRLRRESDALRNRVNFVQAGESAMQARLMSQISPQAIQDESGSEGESAAKAMVKTRAEQEETEAQQQQSQEPQQDQASEEVSVTSDSEDYESFSNEEKSNGSGSGSGSGAEETGGQGSSNKRAPGSDVDDPDDHKRPRASSQ